MVMNKEERIRYLILGGLCLIVVVGIAGWFFTNFELVEKEIRGGVSKEARRNPFLAAEMFLRETGVEVESVSGNEQLYNLPSPNDTLLINNRGVDLSKSRNTALMDWVKKGGNLIVTANRYWNEEEGKSGDALLDELDIRLYDWYELEDIEEEETQSQYDAADLANETTYDDINLDDESIYSADSGDVEDTVKFSFSTGEVVEIDFDQGNVLFDNSSKATASVGSDRGTHLLQVPLGEGVVTIMSDNEFLKNPKNFNLFGITNDYFTSIADYDHAYYLWLLLGDERKVWLLYSLETEGLMDFIWREYKAILISLLLLLVMWLLWLRNRFGPYINLHRNSRRNILEHIFMATNFVWRQDKGQRLFQSNREQLLNWIAQKHPQISELTEEQVCMRLEELSGLAVKNIHQTLYGEWQSEREFIQLTQTMQLLREKLS